MTTKFNQSKYNQEWDKTNMKLVTAKFKNEFVNEFKESCKKLGITQSEVIRQAMNDTIEKAKNA